MSLIDGRKKGRWVLVRDRDGAVTYWRGRTYERRGNTGRHTHEWTDVPAIAYHFADFELAMEWARQSFSLSERRFLHARSL
jgi:hypothetical protein